MSSLMSQIESVKTAIDKIGQFANSEEKDILIKLTGIIEEMANRIEKMENIQGEINEYVTILDENLGNMEDEIYGFEEEEEEFDPFDYVDIKCSECGEILAVEKELINSEKSIICPNCHNNISIKN
ncbi:hypothetical protein CLHOM_05380 [Clostridium homopropionicum DSM 5847]|uniref:Zinc ribbon domain-containing protein n=1 Tax=Clostridium homopropionicum DSM 5847 TaxID=1121318 RepID=A0A0L6ZDA5_9CLOT|nr:CD1247 N-terminal domain-containing protein [Clostridium homopropionicum]KOA20950.1 hypothetical protein CLHOM_05380 [Clostridium homopropionicum DSM 5847]SFG01396.1 hypothetical protein SAMN04488501_104182 [Clostridium homopropionicum]